MDGHSREYAGSATDNADDDLSFYDCNPSVSIPLPFGVPLISRHSSATHNVMYGHILVITLAISVLLFNFFLLTLPVLELKSCCQEPGCP